MLNINQIRQETPATQHLIHFNNAGASLNPQPVIQKIKDYLDEEAQVGGYELARIRANDIYAFYTETARLLNAQAHNIAFATSCTEAYAKALASIPFKKGDIILTSDDDYASNQLCFLSLQARVGVKIVRAKNLSNGDIDVADQYDLSLQIAGMPGDGVAMVTRPLKDGAFVEFHLDGEGRLVGASGIGTGNTVGRDIRLAEMLIAKRSHPDPAQLADPAVLLKALLR